LITAIASLGSALIIAVTAVAAFLQLRHYRNANDIVVYLRLIEQMDALDIFETISQLEAISRRVADDPAYYERLSDPEVDDPEELRGARKLFGFLERLSVLVYKGDIAESLVLAEYADTFVTLWELGRPVFVQRRIAYSPHLMRAFEHLAMRAKAYIDSGQMAREYDALGRDTRALNIGAAKTRRSGK